MADQRIIYTEEMVGATHPTKSDTLNRLAVVEHSNDGTHNPTASLSADLGPGGTAARAAGVTYQNTSAKVRRVEVLIVGTLTGKLSATLKVENANPPTIVRCSAIIDVNAAVDKHVTALIGWVPVNWRYLVTLVTGAVDSWFEYDEI